jgi:hypothetical protein
VVKLFPEQVAVFTGIWIFGPGQNSESMTFLEPVSR